MEPHDERLVRTVDGLADADYAAPSALPGWTRAHVVAHLALNAEGLAGALRGVLAGQAVPMYSSQERRDADIEELAQAEPAELRERLLAGVTGLADAHRSASRRRSRHPGPAHRGRRGDLRRGRRGRHA